MVASRSARENSTETALYSTPSAERLRLSGVSAMPLASFGRSDFRGEFLRALLHHLVELGVRHHLVDQPPFHRALALDALLRRAEHVGVVAADLALVGDAGEPAGARQHREQRQFRQRHGRGAVVGQDDVVGGERQLVAAAGAGAGDDADHALAGEFAGVLDGVAGLVGELAEVDLVGVRRARQHADVGAGAEHPRLARAQQDRRAPRGCSKRSRSSASASSISTPRS